LLTICASPVEGSSTEILLQQIARSIVEHSSDKIRHRWVKLNDLDLTPCQACGEDPSPGYCFIDDDMTGLYRALVDCDCLLIGTPVYFDSVSAQAKLFIDRCNCLRPAAFGLEPSDQHFVGRRNRISPAAMVIVGGEKAWYEGARRTVAGFFKWIGFSNEGYLKFSTTDYNRSGEAAEDPAALAEADRIGRKLAGMIGGGND
jgi:multimeric flavodoxin WrbA